MHLMKISVVMIGLAAASGCGGSSSSTAPSSTSLPTINIVGQNGAQAFSPNPASFAGQQIVFKNNDSVAHHIVLNDGSIDIGDIAPGATSRAVTMPGAGTNYHCSTHPGMIGGISAASGTPPPCDGMYCSGY
jgi:plastocyanin